MTTRVGLGFDVHPFGGDGPLVIGGVELQGPGLLGHSDADVVAHAIADALLGAAGMDDLGTLFPANDERYRGASSIGLLEEVSAMVAAAGWSIVNIDLVVAAETPVLAPHRAEMIHRLERALTALSPRDTNSADTGSFVSVKPKRAEGMGAIGRSEGIAAWAVALLDRE